MKKLHHIHKFAKNIRMLVELVYCHGVTAHIYISVWSENMNTTVPLKRAGEERCKNLMRVT